jgi:tetrapyrrole methylase family protein/MazG family protein
MQPLLDELAVRHGIDPADGLQLIAADRLTLAPFEPGLPLLVMPARKHAPDRHRDSGFAPTALPGRAVHGTDPAELLRALYPADHPLRGLDGAPDTTVAAVGAAELARGAHFLPAVEPIDNAASPNGLAWLVARLRTPNGCPWDREQTHQSLRPFLLEEAYEVYDALEAGSTPELADELGDLLLQIVLHAQYAAEDGVFDLSDVQRAVMTKIVRRHPHVFGDAVAESASEVIRNWEQIKSAERAERAGSVPREESAEDARSDMPAAFAGLSRSLPALAYAQEMQGRAASLGYDWPADEGVLGKIAEEAREVAEATDDRQRHEEFGDLLLVVANLARRLGIDAEAALRAASAKFARRFGRVERLAAERAVELRSLSMDELDELWHAAKAELASEVTR